MSQDIRPEPIIMRRPVLSGFRLRCGRCETGRLFHRYLKFSDQCPDCGLDLTGTDTADGPAFFVGFLAMILFAPAYLWVAAIFEIGPTLLLGYGGVTVACVGFCLLLLPPFKAVLLNLQLRHQAGEGQFNYTGTHGKAPENWRTQTQTPDTHPSTDTPSVR